MARPEEPSNEIDAPRTQKTQNSCCLASQTSILCFDAAEGPRTRPDLVILLVVFAIFVAGMDSPAMFYCLGLATFFPILALNLIVRRVRGWRISEATTDWDRVDKLLSAENGH
jgi:hypothetical protein